MTTDPVFTSAATSFVALVREIPPDAWTGPGLGDWDMRALVGHTARSLVTVSGYLLTTAEREDVRSAAEYYTAIRAVATGLGAADIVERGRQAGRDLGADPAAAVAALAQRALADLAVAGDPLITVIGGLGIRLHSYLPTRTFELAVHSLDIARAAGLAFDPPAEVLDAVTVLAARIAVAAGDGVPVLTALTGRGALPSAFSVV